MSKIQTAILAYIQEKESGLCKISPGCFISELSEGHYEISGKVAVRMAKRFVEENSCSYSYTCNKKETVLKLTVKEVEKEIESQEVQDTLNFITSLSEIELERVSRFLGLDLNVMQMQSYLPAKIRFYKTAKQIQNFRAKIRKAISVETAMKFEKENFADTINSFTDFELAILGKKFSTYQDSTKIFLLALLEKQETPRELTEYKEDVYNAFRAEVKDNSDETSLKIRKFWLKRQISGLKVSKAKYIVKSLGFEVKNILDLKTKLMDLTDGEESIEHLRIWEKTLTRFFKIR